MDVISKELLDIVKDVYVKTMKFNFIKLGLGAAVTAISMLLLLMFGGIAVMCDNQIVTLAMIAIWCFATGATYKIIMNYVGYLIKAAHVAVISEAVTTLVVVLSTFLAWIVPFILLSVIFSALEWNMMIAFILAVIISICIKVAFVDSYMLVKMMFSYMEVAPQTQISFDLYEKLCKLSNSFKKLWQKAKAPATTA